MPRFAFGAENGRIPRGRFSKNGRQGPPCLAGGVPFTISVLHYNNFSQTYFTFLLNLKYHNIKDLTSPRYIVFWNLVPIFYDYQLWFYNEILIGHLFIVNIQQWKNWTSLDKGFIYNGPRGILKVDFWLNFIVTLPVNRPKMSLKVSIF